MNKQGAIVGTGLVEVWNGSTWTVEPTPAKGKYGVYLNGVSCVSAGSCVAELYGVSCRTATSCLAVGSSTSNDALIIGWHGAGWTTESTPVESGGALHGASCLGSGFCMTAGYVPGQRGDGPLSEDN